MMVCVKPLRAAALLLFALALFALTVHAHHSQWAHPSADGHLIYHSDKNGVTIPDYSFAGYRSGGVALPTVPAQINLLPTGADDTAAIQHAIDTVSARPLDANGFRGAVQLAPGVFQCSAALTIAASGVVLRGAGSGSDPEATSISLTGDPHVGIILKGDFALNTVSPATNITDAYVPFGAHTVHVDDATPHPRRRSGTDLEAGDRCVDQIHGNGRPGAPGPRRTLDQRKSPQRASPCHRRQRQCRHLSNRADGLLRFTVSRHGTLHGTTRRSIRTGERSGCRRPSYRRPSRQCGPPRRTHHRDGDRRRRRQLGAQCRHDRHD